MKLQRFIDRPILSIVISVVILVAGLIGLYALSVEQYPDIAPPTIRVSTTYSGANAETVQKSVIVPLEEAINGVENMTYMTSTASNTGSAEITVYFKQGSDPDMAAVNVQNKVSTATSLLPAEVTKVGVETMKRQSSTLKMFALYSPNGTYDETFLTNYLSINVKPELQRISGVGEVNIMGGDYAMRMWLKPDVMAQYELEPSDVEAALASQNIEASAGSIGEDSRNVYQYTLKYRGRLETEKEFEEIVIRAYDDGRVLRLKDIATVELGAQSYSYTGTVNGAPGTTCMINQTAGTNANEIITRIDSYLEELRETLPADMEVVELMSTKNFLDASIHEVIKTLLEAIVLVVLVVYVFLQNARSTLIPTVSIFVSLIGTFAVLYLAGFSINLLTLFALVLAIGTIVDDAIIVVEAVQVKFDDRNIPTGHVALIDASQLQPSHMGGYRNPLHFIDEAQPKERNDDASVMSARKIAANIRPEEITSSVTAYTGAPTVNTRGEVIQGNNRSAALREMWAAQPEQAAVYKQYLTDHAADFGLAPEDVEAMQQPVLVNMLDVPDEDAIMLGQFVAQDTESGGTERIKPKNIVQKMGDNMRNFAGRLLASPDEEMTFSELVDRNGLDVLKWMQSKGYITPTQYRSAFDSRDNLTAEAKNDLKGIMFQSIFQNGNTHLEGMFNALPAKAQKAILATAYRDYDSPGAERMVEEIQNSIRAYYALSQDSQFAEAKNFKEARMAVEVWKRQYQIDDVTGGSYLPAENYSNFALHLAAMYKGESQGLIQGTFNKLYDLIQGTQEENLFEQPDNTPRSLAQAIKEALNIEDDNICVFHDETEEALDEAKEAIKKVLQDGEDVELSPQNTQIRKMQHELVEQHNLSSESVGEGSERHLKIVGGKEFKKNIG